MLIPVSALSTAVLISPRLKLTLVLPSPCLSPVLSTTDLVSHVALVFLSPLPYPSLLPETPLVHLAQLRPTLAVLPSPVDN
jgi:hypothetical protein